MPFDPKALRYDKYGVPFLKGVQIEAIAYEVLGKYCPRVLETSKFTPVADILTGLHENTGLLLAWEDLGFKGTAKILGRVIFSRKILFLDASLDSQRKPTFRFTAAHEIGHWVLHRHRWEKLRMDALSQPMDGFTDDEKTLCKLDRNNPRDWLEYQANIFAASLVMPRKTFVQAVLSIFTG